MILRIACLALLTLGATGCLKLGVGDDGDVPCGPNGECPSDRVCVETIERCLDPDRADQRAPQLVASEVDPPAVRPGTTLTFSLELNEPLFSPPALSLPAGFEVALALDQNPAYAFSIAVPADAADGVVEFSASVADTSGNGANLDGFDFIVDGQPPTLDTAEFQFVDPLNSAYGLGDDVILRIEGEPGLTPVSALIRDEADGGTVADVVDQFTEATPGVYIGSISVLVLGLSDGQRINASLTYNDDAENAGSIEAASVEVDGLAPTAPSLIVNRGNPTTLTAAVVVEAAADDARHVIFEAGRGVATGFAGEWIALAPELTIELTAGAGPKEVAARFRDDAGNETTTPLVVSVTLLDDIQVDLSPPAEQTEVKLDDLVTITGALSAGSVVTSAVVLDGGAPAGDAGLFAATVVVDGDGLLSGSFSVTGVVDGQSIALELVVDDAGVSSTLRSNALLVDLTPPSAPTLNFGVSHTSAASQVVTISAEPGQVALDGAGVQNPRPFDAGAAASYEVVFTPGEGDKVVNARVRDGAHNVSLDGEAVIVVDIAPPAPPNLAQVELVEDVIEPTDPAELGNHFFEFTGNPTALGEPGRVLIFADDPALGATAIGSSESTPLLGFAPVQVAHNSAERFFVVAEDLALNQSAALMVAMPQLQDVLLTPALVGRDGNLTFTAFDVERFPTIDLVRIADGSTVRPFEGGSPPGGGLYTFTSFSFSVFGAPPEHGFDRAVIRVFYDFDVTPLGLQSGVHALVVSFDSVVPTFDAARISMVPAPPGQSDTVVGTAGAIFDEVEGVNTLALEPATVSAVVNGNLVFTTTVNADGSFVLDVGDNALANVDLSIGDGAGNRALGPPAFQNEIAAPAVSALRAPVRVSGGELLSVSLVLSHSSDLASAVVDVDGVALAPAEALDLATSDGQSRTFTFEAIVDGAFASGFSKVQARVLDIFGNEHRSSRLLLVDQAPPVVTVDPVSDPSRLSGRVEDPLTGVRSARYILQNTSTGSFFDGASFSSATAVEHPIASFALSRDALDVDVAVNAPLVAGDDFAYGIVADDDGGNTSALISQTFTAAASLDTVAFTTRPGATDTARDPSFAFVCSAGACSFECSLDGAVFAACTSPHVELGLALGPHSFVAREAGGAGAQAQVDWTLVPAWRSVSMSNTRLFAVTDQGELYSWAAPDRLPTLIDDGGPPWVEVNADSLVGRRDDDTLWGISGTPAFMAAGFTQLTRIGAPALARADDGRLFEGNVSGFSPVGVDTDWATVLHGGFNAGSGLALRDDGSAWFIDAPTVSEVVHPEGLNFVAEAGGGLLDEEGKRWDTSLTLLDVGWRAAPLSFSERTTASAFCGISATGTARCVGNNSLGQLGAGFISDDEPDFVDVLAVDAPWQQVTAINSSACAIGASGALFCWGDPDDNAHVRGATLVPNGWLTDRLRGGRQMYLSVGGMGVRFGQFSLPDVEITPPAPALLHNDFRFLLDDGRLAFGTGGPFEVRDDEVFVELFSFVGPSFGRRADGQMFSLLGAQSTDINVASGGGGLAFGRNLIGGNALDVVFVTTLGQIAITEANPSAPPATVFDAATDWQTVVGTESHFCALKQDGRLFCSGLNLAGQLGDGTTNAALDTMVQVGTDSDWTRVAAGNTSSCGIRDVDGRGELYCWGFLPSDLTFGPALPRRLNPEQSWVEVAISNDRSRQSICAVDVLRRVFCAGDDDGQGAQPLEAVPRLVVP